mmetsp:Transcript_51331/g.123480  ORF Transcript_51331/g.123480 Transcript_51331/m.123480 type:complete len:253 (-) Transcript_51331:356-1114(-)
MSTSTPTPPPCRRSFALASLEVSSSLVSLTLICSAAAASSSTSRSAVSAATDTVTVPICVPRVSSSSSFRSTTSAPRLRIISSRLHRATPTATLAPRRPDASAWYARKMISPSSGAPPASAPSSFPRTGVPTPAGYSCRQPSSQTPERGGWRGVSRSGSPGTSISTHASRGSERSRWSSLTCTTSAAPAAACLVMARSAASALTATVRRATSTLLCSTLTGARAWSLPSSSSASRLTTAIPTSTSSPLAPAA